MKFMIFPFMRDDIQTLGSGVLLVARAMKHFACQFQKSNFLFILKIKKPLLINGLSIHLQVALSKQLFKKNRRVKNADIIFFLNSVFPMNEPFHFSGHDGGVINRCIAHVSPRYMYKPRFSIRRANSAICELAAHFRSFSLLFVANSSLLAPHSQRNRLEKCIHHRRRS
ncbi:MAG: hypothetical protein K2Y28_02810 [Burkholderiaceae bacterium]|nr:hypothetical protein [Burkholderiaceae bacterium]